jgi:hypothetical protein
MWANGGGENVMWRIDWGAILLQSKAICKKVYFLALAFVNPISEILAVRN